MKKGRSDFILGFLLTGLIVALALLSLVWTPYDINATDAAARLLPPSLLHPFGTDSMGRDVFSRAITGARFTLFVAAATVGCTTVIASILGLAAGYLGGAVDEIIMRLVDALSSFPGILTALIIVTVMESGKYTIILALTIMFIPSFTRIVRTGTLQYKDADFVRSNRVFGDSGLRLLLVHIFPNTFPLLLSSIVVGFSNAILAESSMSYLGLGIQPPAPSWGRMLYEAQSTIFTAPWCALAPGLMIVVTIIGFNCLGEGIRKRYLDRA